MFARYLKLSLCVALVVVCVVAFQNCTPGFMYDTSLASFTIDQIDGTDSSAKVQQGRALYATNCEGCHSQVDDSPKRNTTIATLNNAIASYQQMNYLAALDDSEIELIVLALNSGSSNSDILTGTPSIAKTWATLQPQSCSADGVARDIVLLTRAQYANAVQDILGLAADVSKLPAETRDFYTPDASSGGQGLQDVTQLTTLYNVAAAVASSFETNFAAATLKLSSCDQTKAACQTEITTKLMSRLFRKNLAATDEDLVAINAKFASTTDFKTRLKNTLTAALMSPRFLYIAEYQVGYRSTALTQNQLRTLSDAEVASRLSFLIWNSVPDETLLSLADSKTLSTSGVLKAQLTRMLSDSKADRFVKNFTTEWLNIGSLESTSKDTSLVTGFSSALMSKMKTETEQFVLNDFKAGGDMRQLFTSQKTFVDATLASHYGMSGVTGTNFREVTRTSADLAAGLLAQGSVSSISSKDTTDPIHRGLYYYARFLCGRISDPPASAALVVISGTKYEQLVGRLDNTNCSSCHSKFEPYGYVAEALDPIGRLRTDDEAGDAVGRTVASEKGTQLTKLSDLGTYVSSDPLAGFCLMRNLEKYALSSGFAFTRGLQCHTENQLYQAYKNGNSFKSYVESVVLSPVFLQKMETY